MQSFNWYVNRLSLMSPGEVTWRIARAVVGRFEGSAISGAPPPANAAAVRLPEWPAPTAACDVRYIAAADDVLAGRVDLFGARVRVGFPDVDWNCDPVSGVRAPLVPGNSIDYRDASLVGSARNVWELNRQFQLVTLAQAWALTGETRYREGAWLLLESWLRSCPCSVGINWTSALEHGIRLVNWYIAARMLGSDRVRGEPVQDWLESIYRHCRFIWRNRSRYSSANNHLIGEAAGLYVASCAWPCWSESETWRARARSILEREARRQVHEDGVTREQTTGYQVFVLQLLIIAGLAGELHGEPFSRSYWQVVRDMIGFLRSISDCSGRIPDFGDSDDGMAFILAPDARSSRLQDLLELDDAFSLEGGMERPASGMAAWLLEGFPKPSAWPAGPRQRRSSFPTGGYYALGGELGTKREALVVFDAAPLGYLSIAAHGHADCLSFVLTLGGVRILIDPGTYCYHDDLAWRSYFRSTAAHNTVRIDGVDQSEQGGPFMWLRKAQPTIEPVELEAPVQRVRARHDGYTRLRDPVVHRRELRMDAAGRCLEVIDTLECRRAHRAERFWHFGEECTVGERSAGVIPIHARNVRIELHCEDADAVRILRGSNAPRAGWVSPRFGSMAPTSTAVFTNELSGDRVLRTIFRWTFE